MKYFLVPWTLLSLSMFLGACQQHRQLVPDGLRFVHLGDEMLPPNKAKIKGKFLRDTLFKEEAYQWRAAVLDYPTGKVYIEEDFYGQNRVNRIRVEAGQLIFRKEIFAGMSLKELKRLPWQWEVSYLEDFQVWDLHSGAFPQLHLLVSIDESSLDKAREVASLNQLSDQGIVKALVFL